MVVSGARLVSLSNKNYRTFFLKADCKVPHLWQWPLKYCRFHCWYSWSRNEGSFYPITITWIFKLCKTLVFESISSSWQSSRCLKPFSEMLLLNSTEITFYVVLCDCFCFIVQQLLIMSESFNMEKTNNRMGPMVLFFSLIKKVKTLLESVSRDNLLA